MGCGRRGEVVGSSTSNLPLAVQVAACFSRFSLAGPAHSIRLAPNLLNSKRERDHKR